MWRRPFASGMVSLQAPNDARFVQIVGRHFHFDAVANGESNPAFAHFAADGRQNEVLVVELDAEHGARQDGLDDSFDFDWRFFHRAAWTAAISSGWRHLADQPETRRRAGNRREQRQQRVFSVSAPLLPVPVRFGLVTVAPTAAVSTAPVTALAAAGALFTVS